MPTIIVYLYWCSIDTAVTGVTARVRLLDPAVRPGSLDTSAALRDFILASDIRMRMIDLINTTDAPHMYYSISELSIAARYVYMLAVEESTN